ncbi:transient receptor potential cation channel trpm isoform X3 [Brachionus plicatilis]|uniref:Transient receptor potential cation channel trpm isoform X3 n=1 Tax=Brachionus plicatilis TaxID=10195 RepID=A0A3M7SFL0_BRAPC|nr:transient receptor potential cation channel trpm isoform X3 [Brachionus plicatilis]
MLGSQSTCKIVSQFDRKAFLGAFSYICILGPQTLGVAFQYSRQIANFKLTPQLKFFLSEKNILARRIITLKEPSSKNSILIALSFRVSNVKQLQVTARLIYCVNTIYWVIKLMEFLLINKYVGPLIIIASRMLIDLLNFIIILVILLMCFGLSRQAIKYPNEEFRWELVKGIFLEPYFMLYGEVYADTIDPICDMENSPNSPECQPGHWITPITMTIFMIVACLLFLSILIASFNNTFVRISRQSALFWKCQRYHFVTSYEAKPIFGPPFTLIILILRIIKYSIRLCSGKKIKFDRKLKSFLSEDMIQRLHDFEENCVYEYSCDSEQSIKNQMEEKINYTKNQLCCYEVTGKKLILKKTVDATIYYTILHIIKSERNYKIYKF